MRYTVKSVTPELAGEYLSKNTRNRRLRSREVDFLAGEMAEGRWKPNGDTIVFSNEDVLVDGQHRLHAIIKAGVTLELLVVEGVDPEAYETKDLGARRSAADVLERFEEKNVNTVCSTLGVVHGYMLGKPECRFAVKPNRVRELLELYPGVSRSVSMIGRSKELAPPSVTAATHFLFWIKDPEFADKALGELSEGVWLGATDPIYHLRERLIRNCAAKAKLPKFEIFALFIKAWNCKRAGKPMGVLRWINSSDKPEAFPTVE